MSNSLDLSIVIPCLNEEKTLPIVIKKALKSLRRLNINGEVVVADNGSRDNSAFVAESLGARVVHCSHRGYGNALKCGFQNSKGKFLIMGDADDSYNFEEIDDFVEYLRDGYDIVIGTRLRGKIEKGAMPFLHRYLGTPILTFLLNLFFGTKITDCNCGMRGLTRKSFDKLGLSSAGMEFASEMIIKAGVMKMKIKEIPITLYQDKRDKPPHLNTWRDGFRHLKFMFLYAPNFLFVWPGFSCFILGSIIMIPQVRGPLHIGNIYMDIHFMILGLTLAIIGVLILEMGMIIKLFSHLNNLYPQDRFVRWLENFTFEKGIFIGGVIFLVGIIGDIVILAKWIENNFHDIQLFRLGILSFYLMFLGLSLIFFSFLRTIMESGQKKYE